MPTQDIGFIGTQLKALGKDVFPKLEVAGGRVIVVDNKQLGSFECFAALQSASSVVVTHNDKLTAITNFAALRQITGQGYRKGLFVLQYDSEVNTIRFPKLFYAG